MSEFYTAKGRRRFSQRQIGKRNTRQLEANFNSLFRGAGNKLANTIATFTGRGAYKKSSARSFSTARNETGALTVKRCEYIQDITGFNVFTNTNWVLNPGNPTLFPWLSQIAQNYDEYQFNQLVFEYRSVTAVLSSTATIGTVIMTCNYNVTAPNFTQKQPMMEYDSARSCNINENLFFGVECDPRKNSGSGIMDITTSTNVHDVSFGQDPKTYFLGNMQIAIVGTPATGQVGELWVHYNVTLRKPRMYSTLGNGIQSIYATATGGASQPFTLTQQFDEPLAGQQNSVGLPFKQTALSSAGQTFSSNVMTAKPTAANDKTEGTIFAGTAHVMYQFPSNIIGGTYRVSLVLECATSTAFTCVSANTPNITVVTQNSSTALVAGSRQCMWTAIVRVTDSGINNGIGKLTFIGCAFTQALVTPGRATFAIEQVNPLVPTI